MYINKFNAVKYPAFLISV